MHTILENAVERLVTELCGAKAWRELERKAKTEDCALEGKNLPGESTERLVLAAAEWMGLTCEEMLEALGEFMPLYVAETLPRQDGLAAGGLLRALDELDGRRARGPHTLPRMRSVELRVDGNGEQARTIHCESAYEGVASVLVGYLKGLGQRFGTPLEVRHVVRRTPALHKDTFEVVLAAA
ncbi:MAG: heme NO-binding domain-containing protein [Betaproteobacteria bacterium]|nr:heme NO-binding domain-containing protein [Betaproteobacteria bacterium]